MVLYDKTIEKFRRWLVSAAVARRPIADLLTEELRRASPDLFADAVAPTSIVRGAGQDVVAMLSDDQKEAVVKDASRNRLDRVIEIVSGCTGGSFKYVGRGTVRVIIGSGTQKLDGWLATDIDNLNIVEEASWRRLFNPADVDRLLAEHVFEHLTLKELHTAFHNAFNYLRPGGVLRLAVPDAFHPSRYYYNLVKPGGWETPFQHMLFLDHELLERVARSIGFEVRLLEYFDESGVFHQTEYSADDGPIERCAKNNSGLDINDQTVMREFYASIPEHLRGQFIERRISYTSLIADLVKPI